MFLRGLNPLEQIRNDYEILEVLESIAVENECAVILTNTMTPEITGSFDGSISQMKPTLGYSHHHRIHQRILLTKDECGNIIAGVQKTKTEAPAAVALKITKNGVTDAY